MSDPQLPGGRHARAAPATAWDRLSGPWSDAEGDGEPTEPVDARDHTPYVPGSSRKDRAGWPAHPDSRLDRLRADLLDRLPVGGQRVAIGLGRHWWLPVVVVIAALALAVGAVVRARPVLAGTPIAAGAVARTPTASAPPQATGGRARSGSSLSPGASTPAPPSTTSMPPRTPATVVVDVAGRVRRPGVIRLAAGARIIDAITAAGGALPRVDLTSLDLAQPVSDGEQIRVGLPGPAVTSATPASTAAAPGGGAPGAESAPAAMVDINTADAEQLDTLPGIGPVLAARIVAWRTAHGPFATVDDLEQVPGIGAGTLEKFRSQITAGS